MDNIYLGDRKGKTFTVVSHTGKLKPVIRDKNNKVIFVPLPQYKN